MKNQINFLNVAGALVSVSLMALLYFLPSFNGFSPQKRRSIFKTHKAQIQSSEDEKTPQQTNVVKTQKEKPIARQQMIETEVQKQEIEFLKEPEPIKQITAVKTQKEKPIARQQMIETEVQKQDLEYTKLAAKSLELPPKSNGCPKNLDYYTKKPRPKQTPEECITCEKLIDCVCLTSN